MSNPDTRTPSFRSLARARRLLVVMVAIWLVPVICAVFTGGMVWVLLAVVLAPFVAWMAMEVRRATRERRN